MYILIVIVVILCLCLVYNQVIKEDLRLDISRLENAVKYYREKIEEEEKTKELVKIIPIKMATNNDGVHEVVQVELYETDQGVRSYTAYGYNAYTSCSYDIIHREEFGEVLKWVRKLDE